MNDLEWLVQFKAEYRRRWPSAVANSYLDSIAEKLSSVADKDAALEGIAELDGKTLLNHPGYSQDVRLAYSQGAALAFSQAAEIAKSALRKAPESSAGESR